MGRLTGARRPPSLPVMAVDPGSYDALTFDCYGTLIDWRGGLLSALSACPSMSGVSLDEQRFLGDRETEENRLESGPYLPVISE